MDKLPVCVKKRKLKHKNFDDCSKEELINIIHQLETTVTQLKKSKSTSSDQNVKTCKAKRSFDFSKYNYRHIALKFLYLGWDYNGFVTQDDTTNTIEYHVFNALKKGCLIEDRLKCNYSRCGRTDQGVSSFSQVISLTVRSRLNFEKTQDSDELPYCKILNSLLAKDIRVIAWSPVSKDFNARFSCKMRTYKYWFPRGNLNIEAMNEAVQSVLGLHDFRNLCKMDVANGVVNFKRRIHQAYVSLYSKNHTVSQSGYDMCEITIMGEAFIWHQIRAIVSVLFLVGQGKERPDIIEKLLDVDKYPRKPQYVIANPIPLNLFHCEFENIDWKIDQKSLNEVIISLQSHWTSSAVKCFMIENMLKCCDQLSNDSKLVTDQYSVLFKDVNSKTYKPLLLRPTAESLEDRISHYIKKGKLTKMNFNDTHDSL